MLERALVRTEIVAAIDLIRHGESKRNRPEYRPFINGRMPLTPLTAYGRAQMVQLDALYKRVHLVPEQIYAPNGIVRALASAEILRVRHPEVPLHLDYRLAELSNGAAEGCLKAQVYTRQLLQDYREHPGTFRYSEGESIHQVERRIAGFLHTFRMSAHPTKHNHGIFYSQAVTSRGTIVAALRWALGVDPDGPVDLRVLGDHIYNATVTRIGFEEDGRPHIMFIGRRGVRDLQLKTRF